MSWKFLANALLENEVLLKSDVERLIGPRPSDNTPDDSSISEVEESSNPAEGPSSSGESSSQDKSE